MSLSLKIRHLEPTQLHKFTTLQNLEELDEFLEEHKIDLTEEEKDVALEYIDIDKTPISCEDVEEVAESEWWDIPKDLVCPVCQAPVLYAVLEGFFCRNCNSMSPR